MKARFWLRRFDAAAAAVFLLAAAGSRAAPDEGQETTNAPASNPLPTSSATATRRAHIVLRPELTEIVRLAESHVGDSAIRPYIKRTGVRPVTADELVYLHDLGISPGILTALAEQSAPAQQAAQSWGWPTATEPEPPSVVPPEMSEDTNVPTGYYDPGAYGQFYSALAPYGDWLNLPGHGWCWQPKACSVDQAWQPYCDGGHWVWSDRGWYWNSEYSWGWAPFHYGRWWRQGGNGWVWAPDRNWGPAWVCWRQGPASCGWAPLPPGAGLVSGLGWQFNGQFVGNDFGFRLPASAFTFVRFDEFSARYLSQTRLPPAEVRAIFQQTSVNDNLDFGTGFDSPFRNRGIDYRRIEAATGKTLVQANVGDLERGNCPLVLAGGGGLAEDRSARQGIVPSWMQAGVNARPISAGSSAASPANGNSASATPAQSSPRLLASVASPAALPWWMKPVAAESISTSVTTREQPTETSDSVGPKTVSKPSPNANAHSSPASDASRAQGVSRIPPGSNLVGGRRGR